MQSVLVDTDIAIDYLRGAQYAYDLMLSLWNSNKTYLSVLSVYELHAGIKDTEKKITDNFINACFIEVITPEIAEKGGELFRRYRTNGITLTSIDCLIMSTAIVKGYKIATKNIKHYPDKRLLMTISLAKKEKH